MKNIDYRKLLMPIALVICFVFMSLVVQTNGDVQVGSEATAIYNDAVGRFYQAFNWDFNPNSTGKGLIFEYGAAESSGLYTDGDYAVIWSPGDYDRLLRIYDEDFLSAGSTTYEKAYIDGTGSYFKASDKRIKKDVVRVKDPIEKLNQISGVNYKFISTGARKKGSIDKVSVGFIAQEVEAAIPEVVATDEHGNKFVNYEGIIPYLVEAIKSQKRTIDSLKLEVSKLKK